MSGPPGQRDEVFKRDAPITIDQEFLVAMHMGVGDLFTHRALARFEDRALAATHWLRGEFEGATSGLQNRCGFGVIHEFSWPKIALWPV
ncbi:MAG TPA: hypothetical protein VJV78_21665 [Polyangiales bacterium]|nr:hypothetical protein [Polyangiales bacterium]